ncbi:GIY-YIG nuclease family protein [Rhodopirellula sp. P2]|uniref:GIY-YIG nuclease family protein n=1 Tax=Rhodopirellula sp. P2 TaxID=2127060 RepID=UPI002367E849|nr:GIY-YIG nuclease family protein [Rhodopirellula sp. P2]WDQ18775.1 GIY-YIG nuclease family protein [Rhodopirellula sp. P2]
MPTSTNQTFPGNQTDPSPSTGSLIRCFFAVWLAMAASQDARPTLAQTTSARVGSPSNQAIHKDFTPESIREAFRDTHQGFSSDELILQDKLRDAFLQELGIAPKQESQFDAQRAALRALLQLRKRGDLNVPTTQRSSPTSASINAAIPTAEIAIRTVLDRHDAMIDDVLCDPKMRMELQQEAERLSKNISAETVRRAVLRLRKSRRLRPELVLRVADWDRTVTTHPMKELDLESLPNTPGVYLFRDSTGYLYIGEAIRLRDRIGDHLRGSHNAGLANVLSDSEANPVTLELHAFPNDSPAKKITVRRAYESELIRSRHPRFNLQP